MVRAVGSLPDQPDTIKIGSKSLKINGTGSVLAVSNGAPLNLQRENVRSDNGLIELEGEIGRAHV